MFADFWKSVKDPELRMAWAVAVAADALQIGAFPLFAEGAISPLDSVLDLVVAFMLIRLVGRQLGVLADDRFRGPAGCRPVPWTAALLFVSHDRSRFERAGSVGARADLWATLRPREKGSPSSHPVAVSSTLEIGCV
jgi:hypothetical protein